VISFPLGLPALALTDLDGVYGVVRAHAKCAKAEVDHRFEISGRRRLTIVVGSGSRRLRQPCRLITEYGGGRRKESVVAGMKFERCAGDDFPWDGKRRNLWIGFAGMTNLSLFSLKEDFDQLAKLRDAFGTGQA
jgi:hypothetical protein